MRQEFDIPSNAVVCFTAARLEAVKGYQYQLEAIKQLKQSETWDKLYFVWAGAGSLEAQLKEAIEQLGVSSQVKLLGQRWDIQDWLDASDIFILPSELEGMPLCIIEAMAKGLPVIASAVSGIPEELGNTGKLLTDPKVEPQTTITELVTTIQAWFVNSELRQSIGQACKKRAEEMFKEERMVKETVEVIERVLLPVGDYVSPGFSIVLPDKCFPNMIVGDTSTCSWSYLRREVSHNWYVDKRQPTVGFLSRDEAHILYNTALKFKGKKALEIGCWLGWSACHLALAGVELDVVDPLLDKPEFYENVSNSLEASGVLGSVNLIAGFSPQKVEELAVQLQGRWSLIFIDGNHDAPAPLKDAIVCEQLAESDALILFHDLASPNVAQGLDYLKQRGWNTMIYQTMQIMGVAWRGNVEPVKHQPDPKIEWRLPGHLQHYSVSGLSNQLLTWLSSCVNQYKSELSDQSALVQLRKLRKNIADLWLDTAEILLETVYLSDIGKAHLILLNSDIQNGLLPDSEQVFLCEVATKISSIEFDTPKAIQYLLVAMLYRRADQLMFDFDLPRIPQWLINDYLKYMLEPPRLFHDLRDVDNYYQFMQHFIDYLHINIISNPGSDLWRNIATKFSQIANFIPWYFTEVNLKDIYVKRAEIIEQVLKLKGYEVDYEFRDRPVTRKKIRLGILASHFTPAAETFASLPVYEYISREFEVILYSLNQTGHPLEQYCQICANSFKLLPQDLADQVNLIRNDDLDILFIATNVTAVTNQICLLSLHRLARTQVTSVASVVTTGMRHVDYYISGKLTDPLLTAEQNYKEKLVKLEGTAQCFSYGSEQKKATVTVSRESLDISEATVIFISGANFFKIIPKLIDTWARIISATPNSVLVLLPFGPNWSNTYPKKSFSNHLSTIFLSYGLTADRLIVLDPQPVPSREDVKEYFKIADAYLDSYPFSGTTSLIEPLEIGLPIVSRQGNTFRSSMGAALLQELQIPDLITDSEEAYIQLAIALGTNPELRQQKSAQIKERMQANPRFLDSRSYSAQMGEIFQKLFYKYQAETLTENFKLRETNLIIFPDWNQPEEVLYQDLAGVITSLVNHPDKTQITLLIHQGALAEEEANLLLADITMNLLLEEDLDAADDPEISLVGQISEMQGEALIQRLRARIVLEHEKKEAIAQVKAENIPSCELDKYC